MAMTTPISPADRIDILLALKITIATDFCWFPYLQATTGDIATRGT